MMKLTEILMRTNRRVKGVKTIDMEQYIFDYQRDQFLKNKVSREGEKRPREFQKNI